MALIEPLAEPIAAADSVLTDPFEADAAELVNVTDEEKA